MPAVASTDKLLEVIQKSKLVEAQRLNQFMQQFSNIVQEQSPAHLASLMVREGILTSFQAKQLLHGRWRRFIIGNKYKVLDLLGQGGMGAVYLCEHMLMRRLVALKVLPQEKLSSPGALERFQREARAIATLDDPNIVHAYDMDREDDMYFMVMEYVDGPSLEVLVGKHYKNQGMDPIRAAHYISQAAMGLQHAHEMGWVHRDIKPANLLIDRTGTIKILDLGLSRLFKPEEDEQLTKKYDGGYVLGTADYIAPEQALNVSGVDIRADIYSLGGTFYFLLTGQPPFNKGTIAQKLMYHQSREPESILGLRPDVPEDLVAVVRQMMTKNPDHRFLSPVAVVEALSPWTTMPIPPPPDDEMPKLCALVRNLLPSSAGVNRSGNWRTMKKLSNSTPEIANLPVVAWEHLETEASSMPTSDHVPDTVCEPANLPSETPRILPMILDNAEHSARTQDPIQRQKQIKVIIAICSIVAVLVVVLFILLLIMTR